MTLENAMRHGADQRRDCRERGAAPRTGTRVPRIYLAEADLDESEFCKQEMTEEIAVRRSLMDATLI